MTPAIPKTTAYTASSVPAAELSGLLRALQAVADSYVASLRRAHDSATPAQIVHVLTKQFATALAINGTGTGLLSIAGGRRRKALGLSVAHFGLSTTISAFYLLTLANVYGLSGDATRAFLASTTLGDTGGPVLEQHVAGTWWRSALAYLPVSQVRFLQRAASKQFSRAARTGTLSRTAGFFPPVLGGSLGLASGKILANRVVGLAVDHLGRPPSSFPTSESD